MGVSYAHATSNCGRNGFVQVVAVCLCHAALISSCPSAIRRASVRVSRTLSMGPIPELVSCISELSASGQLCSMKAPNFWFSTRELVNATTPNQLCTEMLSGITLPQTTCRDALGWHRVVSCVL